MVHSHHKQLLLAGRVVALPEVGVVGLGSVGWAVVHGLSRYYSYAGYDVLGNHDWDAVLDTKIVFICVGTPMGDNGGLDCSNVDQVLNRLNSDRYSGIVVIKSTISIGFMDSVCSRYPGLRLVYMPEFLREKDSYSWFLNPDRIVAAGERENVNAALEYFKWPEGAEIIRMDFRSAEIGKLAHNSYIATKVSFTNEIERICKSFNADPYDAMKIVWTDRRVKCSEHLTPGLGPYGGKCIVKDMNELTDSSRSKLLSCVREINSICEVPETKFKYKPVVAIIPTKNRPDKLQRAIRSIMCQTYKPRLIVIVTDQGAIGIDETLDVLSQFSNELPIKHVINQRSINLSGAINSGLNYMGDSGFNPEETYIAFLDDDDWWDRRYLENCIKFAMETESDWVISGLIRHDERYPEGYLQDIPAKIDVADFLVTNPNIQGSNLFIRADKIMSINGFDEKLVSTTDRDVCIRLLQSKDIRYSILRNHLVHHDASLDPGRLSHPGSPYKKAGLSEFYRKYAYMMSESQKIDFKQRAKDLFKIDMDEAC